MPHFSLFAFIYCCLDCLGCLLPSPLSIPFCYSFFTFLYNLVEVIYFDGIFLQFWPPTNKHSFFSYSIFSFFHSKSSSVFHFFFYSRMEIIYQKMGLSSFIHSFIPSFLPVFFNGLFLVIGAK